MSLFYTHRGNKTQCFLNIENDFATTLLKDLRHIYNNIKNIPASFYCPLLAYLLLTHWSSEDIIGSSYHHFQVQNLLNVTSFNLSFQQLLCFSLRHFLRNIDARECNLRSVHSISPFWHSDLLLNSLNVVTEIIGFLKTTIASMLCLYPISWQCNVLKPWYAWWCYNDQ